ncbi:MAG: DUF736 family protein [Candidatus Anstonellales archaeon]
MDEYEEIENKIGISDMQKETEGQESAKEKRKPDYRVLQPETDAYGKKVLRSVGAMWKAESKDGKSYYILKIGELRLLVFPNTPK